MAVSSNSQRGAARSQGRPAIPAKLSKRLALILAGALAAAPLQAAEPASKETPPAMTLGSKPQELIITKITVSDLAKSLDFYTRVVGLKPTDPDEFEAARASSADFVEIGLNHAGSRSEAALMLIRRKGDTPTPESARRTWIAFKVPDVAAAIARVKAEGYEIRNEATPYEDLIFGIAQDPDGYTVEFLSEK
jgi:predicted enzyme related to lactoylglutathione lyase